MMFESQLQSAESARPRIPGGWLLIEDLDVSGLFWPLLSPSAKTPGGLTSFGI